LNPQEFGSRGRETSQVKPWLQDVTGIGWSKQEGRELATGKLALSGRELGRIQD
jgi:hypothetical protein